MIVSITLMLFLVMLMLALSTWAYVELQSAGKSIQLAKAQQNALMALSIALGELQRTAGPDQRSTATAALGEGAAGVTAANAADTGLGSVVDGTRFWTGVWGNKDAPEDIFTRSPSPVLLNWLVSGQPAAPEIQVKPNGQIESPTTVDTAAFIMPSSPVTVSGGGALSTTTPATANVYVNGEPAALMLGSGSAGDEVAAYVVAPLVEIAEGTGSGPTGRYAWWVGDEGVKAKYNLADPYTDNTTPDDGTSADSRDSRYRVLTAQRNGIDAIDTLESHYPKATVDSSDPMYRGVQHAIALNDALLVSSSLPEKEFRAHVHDLTTYSQGVLADTQFGGLKRDLTFHLDPRSGDTFLDGRNILPDGGKPASDFAGSRYKTQPSLFNDTEENGGYGFATLDLSPRLGPKWDQLKSFYSLAYTDDDTLDVQPAVDIDADPVVVQAAVTPVILETRILFALRAGPSIDTSFVIVLGNPYTRTLTASDGINVRLELNQQQYRSDRWLSNEWGLQCDYIEDGEPAQQLPTDWKGTSDPPRRITTLFKRQPVGTDFINNLSEPYQTYYRDPHTEIEKASNGKDKEVRYSESYFRRHYPILKNQRPQEGDGPADPDDDHPGVLDRVVFQIPPGILELAPGEAKAYRINADTKLSDITIGETVYEVVALEEMSDTSVANWITHDCDPYYVSDLSLFPPALLSGGGNGAMGSNSFFRADIVGPGQGGMDVNLTVPGKDNSVLQEFRSFRIMENGSGYSHVPGVKFYDNPFSTIRTQLTGCRGYRVFGNSNGGNAYNGDSLLANHGEANLLGSFQHECYYVVVDPGTKRGLLRLNKENINVTNGWLDKFDPSTSSQASWGEGNAGNPFRVSPDGRFVVSDIPRAYSSDEVALFSLGQLQHADLSADDEALGVCSQPGSLVANSRYNRFVPRASALTDPLPNGRSMLLSNKLTTDSESLGDSPEWYDDYVPDLPKMTEIRRYDMSYLLNIVLWDDFYFSTIIPAAGSDGATAPKPANRRLVYSENRIPTLGQLRGSDASELIANPSELGPGENGRIAAAWMVNDGAFNVNSVSVEAWKAFLSGLRGLTVNGDMDKTSPDLTTPLARSIRQPGAGQDVFSTQNLKTASTVAKESEDSYVGFRKLNDDQVTTLATEIVKQVKARGPFLSLSQFVNRNLTQASAPTSSGEIEVTETSLSGALQQAIDLSGVNSALNYKASIDPASNGKDTEMPDNAFMPTGDDSGFSPYMNIPGWLTQADILQTIGASLTARSDTFVIRAYGDVINPFGASSSAESAIQARAWCEAVVQRLPEYVDSSERPTFTPSEVNNENRNFGRRFQIVSLRWLTADEI